MPDRFLRRARGTRVFRAPRALAVLLPAVLGALAGGCADTRTPPVAAPVTVPPAIAEAARAGTGSAAVRVDLLNQLAVAHAEAGRFDAAIALLGAARDAAPELAWIRSNLGWALYRAGQLEAARTELLQAIRLDPGYARAQANLAIVGQADAGVPVRGRDAARPRPATPVAEGPVGRLKLEQQAPQVYALIPLTAAPPARAPAGIATGVVSPIVATSPPPEPTAAPSGPSGPRGVAGAPAATDAPRVAGVQFTNASGIRGLARRVEARLLERGSIERSIQVPPPSARLATTRIEALPVRAADARRLAAELGLSAPVRISTGLRTHFGIRVEIGRDADAVHAVQIAAFDEGGMQR